MFRTVCKSFKTHVRCISTSLYHPKLTRLEDAVLCLGKDITSPLISAAIFELPFPVQSQILSEGVLGWQKNTIRIVLVDLQLHNQSSI